MKNKFPQGGVLVALAIPTDARGSANRKALSTHLSWLKSRGVHGVLALGSTGEFLRVSPKERERILALVAELAAPLPVIANVSDARVEVSCALARQAKKLGLAGVSIMPPHFYPVGAADQLAYFRRVADATELPVMLYNFPELTGNRIAPETVVAFAKSARMAAIKQSGGEFSYHKELIRLGRQHGFSVFSGADTRLSEVFKLGAAGCIGGLVNFVPEMMLEIYRACHEGNGRPRPVVVARMCEVGAIVDRLTFPINVPAGMEARGLPVGKPKSVVSEESQRLYHSIVEDLRQLFELWGLPQADNR